MKSVEKLGTYFEPVHYDIKLDLDTENKQLSGNVSITGELTDKGSKIKLHTKDLNISSVRIDGVEASREAGVNDESDFSIEGLQPGSHTIELEYTTPVTDLMHGAYPSYYKQDGETKEVYSTQFESHHAREVFPSVDEPGAKATFDLELTTPESADFSDVISNMPIQFQNTENGVVTTKFETTPKMSTYLLAFAVGALQKKTATTSGGVEVNVFSTKAQPEASLDFSLDIAKRSIEFYDDFYGTKYPLPKSDHLALPDFSSGAMENWGLITYREAALLVDPKNTSISSRRYVATVVAHELAHQWFGNLVTMKWWNDLWLNESFATLMEYLTVDKLQPGWKMWEEFSSNEAILALRRDAIDGVQAVQVDVNHPDEISTLFDGAIVYAKGARMLRMVQQYIGEDAFRAGLKEYFADHAYGNTEGNDLWSALEKSSGKNIKEMMNTWISQPGYPVVSVSRDGNQVTLSQKQFFIGPHGESSRLWPIPLNSDNPAVPELLDTESVTFECDSPFRLNIGDSAHFITNYDDSTRNALLDQIQDGSLDTISRIQILHEATLLARGGVMSSDSLIDLIGAYRGEKSDQVWDIVNLALAELKKFVENDEEAEQKLRDFAKNIAGNEFNRLGWTSIDGESEEDAKLRGTILSMMLYSEDSSVVAEAKNIYANTPLDEINPEIRSLIISTVVKHGDADVVAKLLETYRQSQSPDLLVDICVGITSTKDEAQIKILLDSIKDPKTVKPQDVFRWFAYLMRGRYSRETTWDWLRGNWSWIEGVFDGDKSYERFPRDAAAGLKTREHLQQYKDFFNPMLGEPSLTRSISMGVSELEGKIELLERDSDAVINKLKSLEFDS